MTALVGAPLIKALHVARKAAGIDDDTWAMKVSGITGGNPSTKSLTVVQGGQLLDELNGGTPASARRPNGKLKLTGEYAPKLQALWIAGWNLGLIRDRDDAALVAWIKGQTGIDHPRFLINHDDARKAIEGLKAWLARAGVDWAESKSARVYRPWTLAPGFKIVMAQWTKLSHQENGHWQAYDTPAAYIRDTIDGGFDAETATSRDWQMVMNHFGLLIRAQKAASHD